MHILTFNAYIFLTFINATLRSAPNQSFQHCQVSVFSKRGCFILSFKEPIHNVPPGERTCTGFLFTSCTADIFVFMTTTACKKFQLHSHILTIKMKNTDFFFSQKSQVKAKIIPADVVSHLS